MFLLFVLIFTLQTDKSILKTHITANGLIKNTVMENLVL